MTVTITWPAQAVADIPVAGWPVVYVQVTTPHDQAPLHRYLARLGYCPVRLTDEEGAPVEEWRFHHPDGPRP